ncbi:MAG: excisionase family DNA-binding protein [Chitinophagales bacterium]|nr:excisionase family DNA-binding protein [Chitinophagaceae bacterium]MCB9065433.1 excisionase family DNA-binding protein [Chitinophagales bacterium]
MSSNLRIPKVCLYCNNNFIAQKMNTKYCSLKCAQRNYKQQQREKKLQKANKDYIKQTATKPIIQSNNNTIHKPYLTIKETCQLLNSSDSTIRKAIKDGRIQTIRIGKKHIIRRDDIEKMFLTS